jgi:hypothetical protein
MRVAWFTAWSIASQSSRTLLIVTHANYAHIYVRLQVQVQPTARTLLPVDLSIVPDFRWDEKIHGSAETFLTMVEVDGEIILFRDSFVLRQRYAEDEHNVTITVPMFEPVPPDYYISVISDRWLHAETRLPISFKHSFSPKNSLNRPLSLTFSPSLCWRSIIKSSRPSIPRA